MKKIILCVVIVILFTSCGQVKTVFENNAPGEKWEIIRDDYMVPGAPVSNERPIPNVLSEQEVLLKAADYANEKGIFDPSYIGYEIVPSLMTAKIESPILLIDAVRGEPESYVLTAVDVAGVFLADVGVNPAINASTDEFFGVFGFAIPDALNHYITKREAVELIQSQFPDSAVSEPVAITNLRLDDDPYSHMFFFWYFTVNDSARNAADAGDEYIIASVIPGYPAIPSGVSNRAAIDFAGQRGDIHLNGYRMAKLNKPLYLFDKLNTARAAGGASFAPSSYPAESVGFTPVPLK
jgi:hypothetical protein